MKRLLFILLSIPFGVWLSFSYISPYGGTITLSELVLQLSGARGTFSLGINLSELLGLTLRIAPMLVFQALAGTLMYQYYCTASVYVFSRIERRTAWYWREFGALAIKVFAYLALMLLSALLTALVRWHIIWDTAGFHLLLYHFLIWGLWTLVATLAVNLIALYLGSSSAFAVVAGLQVVCIALLMVAKQFEESPDVYITVLRANPVTCLVLPWQQSRFEGQGYGIYFEDSLAGIVITALLIAVLGAALVKKHDLLVNNAESAGG